MLTRRTFLTAAGAVALSGAAGTAYSMVIEPGFRLRRAEWTIAHPGWPAATPSLRIAVLTDFHAMKPWMPVSRIGGIVEAAMSCNADLIVLLGDFAAGMQRFRSEPVEIADWSKALATLRAPYGVYAVLGNHDWWVDPRGIRLGLEKVGIQVLENETVRLDRGGRRFRIAGLGDQLARRVPGGYRGVDDLDGTLSQIPGDDDPILLLAHEPDIFTRVPKRVTLTLSGHTHGGQVHLPFLGAPFVPSAYGQRFAYGHIVEDGRHLLVSSGLGLSGLPVRFMVPPEIALVTLGAPGGGLVAG